MSQEHEIITQVYAAKQDNQAADRLIEQYLPFIKSETARYIKKFPRNDWDDELSIAMFAFHQAVLSYERYRGAFLPFAARVIQNGLIDYDRKEQRQRRHLSLDATEDEEDTTLMEKLDTGHDEIGERQFRSEASEEIAHFVRQLSDFGLSLTDIAENCPRQQRTLNACQRVLAYARTEPEIFTLLLQTGKLPVSRLAQGAGVDKKTLERHRKYLVAILLAYTNGFEIIRGHLRQISPGKGGRMV